MHGQVNTRVSSFVKKNSNDLKIQGSPHSTVFTSTNSTSTIFSAIGIKLVLVEFPSIAYVVKFVLVEIGYVVPISTNFA